MHRTACEHVVEVRLGRPLVMLCWWDAYAGRVQSNRCGLDQLDLATVPVPGSEPVRRFTWRALQRHRQGLQFMVSTEGLHGFEPLEEQRPVSTAPGSL